MESQSNVSQVLIDLALQIPSLVAILVCMVIVIIRLKRHPKVSAMAAIGLFLILLHAVTFSLVYAFVPELLRGTYGIEGMPPVFQVLGFIFNATRAIAFAPLLVACFIQRPASGRMRETVLARN